MLSPRGAFALVLVSALVVPASALAEPAPPADRALATDLFNQARALVNDGRTAEACPKFAESQRLDPALGTLLNLANCHELEGKTATAWSEFSEALAVAERERQPDRVAFAEAHVSALAQRLARLVVIVPRELETAELEVSRDGSSIPRLVLGTAIPIDPGVHRVEVKARGFEPWVAEVDIADAARREVTIGPLTPVAAPSVVPAPIEPVAPVPGPPLGLRRDLPSHARSAGLITGSVGLVALGVGAVAGILAVTKSSKSESLCDPRCNDEGYALNREAKTAADVSTVSLLIGAAALGVGVVLLVTSGRPADPAKSAWAGGAPALRF